MTATPRRRRAARPGALISAAMLALGLSTVWTAGQSPAGAATDNGAARIVDTGRAHRPLRTGGSATPFNLRLGASPACPGDSASGNYRVQSFLIPSSADINTLTFDANGPVAVDGQFRQPLFDTTTSPYVNELTDIAVPPAVTGGISGLPAFDFAVFAPGDVPAGDYSIGIACTLGPAGPAQLKTFWSTTVTIAASAGDAPAGLTWTAPNAPAESRGDSAPTTTTAPGEPTTRGEPTGRGDSAPTTSVPTSSTSPGTDVAFAGSSPSDPSVFHTVGQLRLTGTSPWYRVGWAVVLLVVGRMVILLVRRPKVLPPSDD